MFNMNYHEEEKILYVTFDGIIDIQDMFSGLKYLEEDPRLPDNLKILENAEKAHVTFNENDIPGLIENLERTIIKFTSVRHAVVHTNPVNTAYAMLGEQLVRKSKYTLKVFSNTEAAKAWLNV